MAWRRVGSAARARGRRRQQVGKDKSEKRPGCCGFCSSSGSDAWFYGFYGFTVLPVGLGSSSGWPEAGLGSKVPA